MRRASFPRGRHEGCGGTRRPGVGLCLSSTSRNGRCRWLPNRRLLLSAGCCRCSWAHLWRTDCSRPELIFSYRTEIGLEWEQQAKIVELITEVQPELVPLQLELLGQTTALLRSIDQEGIGLDEAALRAEKIFSLEQRVKLEHLKLLLRIRNLLRPEQQAKLQALRAAARK